ncbi:hypothetical protein B0H11DRAFT_2274539 [Mycena galericulata]|nr:hypothetical protein B0H11DRAFT_2274539 [Mycena galericulata]
MVLLTSYAIVFRLCFFAGTMALNVPRQSDSTYILNVSTIFGLDIPSPTMTQSAVLSAYSQAIRFCGPDVDAQKQAALQAFNEEVIGISGGQNVTSVDNSTFISWASVHYAPLMEANNECVGAEDQLDNLVDPVVTPNSGPLSTGQPESITGSVAAPTSSSSGSGMVHTPPWIGLPFLGYSLVGLLIVLSY